MVLQKRKEAGGKEEEIQMTDLRDRFNIFEIMGPKSSQIITGALKPIKEEMTREFKKVCSFS